MYTFGHTKSKSDTDFYSNIIIDNSISNSLIKFENDLSKTIKPKGKDMKRSSKSILKKTIRRQEESIFISTFEKILLFKKQIDIFFFRNKLPAIKFDLDNSLQIINKKLEDLINKLIKECTILSKSILIDKLTEFTEVIKSLIETKPQEFYKEVKFLILSKFEKIRLQIFELLENLHEHKEDNENDLEEINKTIQN